MIPNRNVLWASVVAQELARGGVQHVVVAPGSRSTPLVLGLHDQPGLRLSTHLDERAAGFFALGIAKATHRPVAVVVTSGTAVANLLPAVVEARYGRVPLVVLTADRPPELLDVGANQAIDQRGIFASFARFEADVGLPEPDPARVRHLRSLIGRALGRARGAPAGPVHLNFPFREPLEPRLVPGDVPPDWAKGDVEAEQGRADGRPYLDVPAASGTPDQDGIALVAAACRERARGVIVVGPREVEAEFPEAVVALSRATGYPIVADPLSGLRYGRDPGAPIIATYDAFLAHGPTRERLAPDVVLRFGAGPTSKNLLHLLARPRTYTVLVDDTGVGAEESSRAATIMSGDALITAHALTKAVGPNVRSSSWTQDWLRCDATAERALREETRKRAFEGAIVARVIESLPSDAIVFVSNSLPIRDVDRFVPGGPTTRSLHANRGASGIDGIASTALGVAYASGRRVTLIIGDLAFLHDLNGFVAARRLGIPIDILLLNNDGGGIFEFLPIAQHEPPFTELFATPHGLDLGAFAKAVGLVHRRIDVADAKDLAFPPSPNGALLEVRTDRKGNVEHRRAIEASLAHILEAEARVRAS